MVKQSNNVTYNDKAYAGEPKFLGRGTNHTCIKLKNDPTRVRWFPLQCRGVDLSRFMYMLLSLFVATTYIHVPLFLRTLTSKGSGCGSVCLNVYRFLSRRSPFLETHPRRSCMPMRMNFEIDAATAADPVRDPDPQSVRIENPVSLRYFLFCASIADFPDFRLNVPGRRARH